MAGVVVTVLAALDERGLLPTETRDTLLAQGMEPTGLANAIRALREVGPPGIAARDPAESLLVQLDSAPLTATERELARRLLTVHSELITNGDLAGAAEREGCETSTIEALLRRMRRLLRPFPGLGEPSYQPPTPPDLIFERDGDRVRARVTEQEAMDLSVDPEFPTAREADTVVRRVHRRWSMLQGLGDLLADHHADHLLNGSLAFRPLTQAQAAHLLEVHESTISRAVAHRCVQLVSGETVPLRRLFGANHDVRAAVAELSAMVPRPSDRAIAELLAERGIVVSRRAVNKYRRS